MHLRRAHAPKNHALDHAFLQHNCLFSRVQFSFLITTFYHVFRSIKQEASVQNVNIIKMEVVEDPKPQVYEQLAIAAPPSSDSDSSEDDSDGSDSSDSGDESTGENGGV